MKYVLITPARNEERFIQKTLDSICSQTVLPERWVIVDDGSTDSTAAIVAGYASRFPWIELVRRPPRAERSFAGKVEAFNAGFRRLQSCDFNVLGNVDADTSFGPDYFEYLLGKFRENPRLGVGGTAIREPHFASLKNSFYHELDVHGTCQLFRRECFDEIGGYVPNKLGGIDWIAVRTARLKGWETRSFTDRVYDHHRQMGTGEKSILRGRFNHGREDYFLGNHPLWQVFRVAYQMIQWPYVIGGLSLLSGYLYAFFSRMERPISPELLRIHREEQLARLRQLFSRLVRTGHLSLRS
jgi:glycosyltransferase involved in cell wall biosynthesis